VGRSQLALKRSLLALALLLCACQKQTEPAAPKVGDDHRVLPAAPLGVIEVLNGSGVKGAANLVARKLQDKGFDVVKTGNAPDKNYTHTLVAIRRPGTAVGNRVASALGVKRVLPYLNETLLVDATVFVGQDYQEILKP
jgi:LytR cell envelope-related transcriptional attenuator